ncbi:hypothetical protein KU306_16725 (plasmid) [Haloferax larsenii]|uniref:Uncharacterized protein n=1 Tax=Haloferax larsenii TaxID=302484 RepID=A0ABY5RHU7_HALLR|nr:hypothetical protein [Haloferax larsenii]UVE51967.1 hypothetical protein KU306_16725 [Haloferax larsenii]
MSDQKNGRSIAISQMKAVEYLSAIQPTWIYDLHRDIIEQFVFLRVLFIGKSGVIGIYVPGLEVDFRGCDREDGSI